MVFSVFTKLGNSTTNSRTFSSLQKETHIHEQSPPPPPRSSLPQTLATTILLSVPTDLPVLDTQNSIKLSSPMSSPCPALLPSAQILKHLQEQKDSQCLRVEEYQNLVKDLRVELEAVSEQKKNIMKGKPRASGLRHRVGSQGSRSPALSKKNCLVPLQTR